MAMFDKHKSSKQPERAEEAPKAAPPSPAPSAPAPGTSQKVAMVGEGSALVRGS